MNFDKFKKMIMDDSDDEHVMLRSLPATKKQKDEWKNLEKMAEEAMFTMKRHDSAKKLFWAMVEKELDEYRHMHYNNDTDEIEIYASDFDKAKTKGKSVKSPIQIKLD